MCNTLKCLYLCNNNCCTNISISECCTTIRNQFIDARLIYTYAAPRFTLLNLDPMATLYRTLLNPLWLRCTALYSTPKVTLHRSLLTPSLTLWLRCSAMYSTLDPMVTLHRTLPYSTPIVTLHRNLLNPYGPWATPHFTLPRPPLYSLSAEF